MEEKLSKGNILSIALLGLVVVILFILVIIAVKSPTETIQNDEIQESETPKETNQIANNIIRAVNNKNNTTTGDLTQNENKVSDKTMYSQIINEYKTAMKDSEYDAEDNKYNNVNSNIMKYYHDEVSIISYAYYDINKDGTDELIILNKPKGENTNYSIIDLFGYNGAKPVKLIDNESLGDRSKLEIFSNGVMYLNGSNSAFEGILAFYTIQENGYSINTTNYYYKYDDLGNITIYSDEYYAKKVDYSSINEIVNIYKADAEIINLETLDITEIQ